MDEWRMTPFVFEFGSSEETLDPILKQMVKARDKYLQMARSILAQYEGCPSATLWAKVKEKHLTCTVMDIRFRELFECLREKLEKNLVHKSRDPSKAEKKKNMKLRVKQMDKDKAEYAVELSLMREKFDKKSIEVVLEKEKDKRLRKVDWEPDKLDINSSYEKFKSWIRKMKAYRGMTNLDSTRIETQAHLFGKYVDTECHSKCKSRLLSEERAPSFQNLIGAVAQIFKENTSRYLRREEWYRLKRNKDEEMSAFIVRCREAVEYGEVSDMTAAKILTHRLIKVIPEEVKTEVLLTTSEPEVNAVLNALKRFEARKAQEKREDMQARAMQAHAKKTLAEFAKTNEARAAESKKQRKRASDQVINSCVSKRQVVQTGTLSQENDTEGIVLVNKVPNETEAPNNPYKDVLTEPFKEKKDKEELRAVACEASEAEFGDKDRKDCRLRPTERRGPSTGGTSDECVFTATAGYSKDINSSREKRIAKRRAIKEKLLMVGPSQETREIMGQQSKCSKNTASREFRDIERKEKRTRGSMNQVCLAVFEGSESLPRANLILSPQREGKALRSEPS